MPFITPFQHASYKRGKDTFQSFCCKTQQCLNIWGTMNSIPSFVSSILNNCEVGFIFFYNKRNACCFISYKFNKLWVT